MKNKLFFFALALIIAAPATAQTYAQVKDSPSYHEQVKVDMRPTEVIIWHRLNTDAMLQLTYEDGESLTVRLDHTNLQQTIIKPGKGSAPFAHWRAYRIETGQVLAHGWVQMERGVDQDDDTPINDEP